ncbi:ATP-binding protein [Halomarina litorea]|uniref:ATP-binding protein n=1 Tax=Halomarina litorea TaxID=2961595 RepID=UPI0020C3C2E6|nr:ATP-binding protein [Halomarina sp. BCD28]
MSDEFVRESTAHLRDVSDALLAIEREVDPETLNAAFRAAHSLKGNCAMAGLTGASTLAHAVEDLLAAVRVGEVTPEADLVDAALDATDAIEAVVRAAGNGGSADVDAEAVAEALRASLATRAVDPGDGASSADPTPETPPSDPDDGLDDPSLDDEVRSALDSVAEYDDLDELMGTMDDPDTLPDLPEAATLANDASAPEDGEDLFSAVKSEVESESAPADLADLQRDIDAVSFGEFDEDDELGIADLIEGSGLGEDDPTGTAADDAADDTPASDETASGELEGELDGGPDDQSDAFDPFGAGSAADPERQSGFDGSGPFAPPEDSTASRPDPADADPDGSVGSDGSEDPFAAVKAEVESESVPADLADLQRDIDAVSFGEFDEDDELGIADLIEGSAAGTPPGPDETGTDPAGTSGESPSPDPPADPLDSLEPAVVRVPPAPSPPAHPDDLTPAVVRAVDPPAVPDGEALPAIVPATAPDPPADAVAGSGRPAIVPAPEGATDEAPAPPAPSDHPVGLTSAVRAVAPDPPVDPPADLRPAVVPAVDPPADPDDLVPAVVRTGSDDPSPASAAADPNAEAADEVDPEVAALLDDSFEGLDSEQSDPAPAETEADADAVGADDGIDPDVEDLLDAPFAEADDEPVGFERNAETAAFEDRFGGLFGEGPSTPTRTVTTIDDSSVGDTFAPDAPPTPERSGDAVQSISVDVADADALLSQVEALTTARYRLESSLGGTVSEEALEALTALGSVTADLRGTVMDVRLMPFERATRNLPRLVRDIARAQDKRVTLDVTGREVGLDRSVIDRIGDPLVHLVRNAVDHGIEAPEAREAAGKPTEGRVEVRAERIRDGVVIEVRDDGRGIDAEAVREQAVESGLLDAEAAADLPDEECFPLVLEPGFSTAEEVTDVSGRGVGMDVVDRVASDLGGSVTVESTPGAGTTVRLQLPVTVAVAEVLFVGVGDERYGIPLTAVEEVEAAGANAVETVDGEATLAVTRTDEDGDPADGSVERYPLVRLATALETPGPASEGGTVVRLRPETRRVALQCDEVLETREVVVRPYEGLLGDVTGVSGATLLGGGELVNIIDVATI